MSTYAKCPLRYLFTHQYKCEAIALEKDEDALEATDIGTMFHSIAENFANEVQKGIIILGDEISNAIKYKIEAIAKDVYAKYMQKHFIDEGRSITVFHKIVLNDLIKGLHDEHHQKGLLVRFLEYVYGEGRLDHFKESEKHFMLDENFELTIDKQKALVRGFIDRIDENKADNIISIIDYKTGKYNKKKENRLLEEMHEYKQFQLPLYLLYAKRAFTEHEIDAFLVSFKDGDGSRSYAHLSTNSENGMLFDDGYEENLIQRIKQIKCDIEEGEFSMSPSELNCEYCEFERICHKSVLPVKESHE
jgi:ATP-dependent helicase/DNAse subunit B